MKAVAWHSTFQLILNPIRDWNNDFADANDLKIRFQLILNPIRDWNPVNREAEVLPFLFQLILNPIRDWNACDPLAVIAKGWVPINLKPY